MTITIFEEPSQNLVMTVDPGCSSEFVQLLEQTVWGTDGIRYKIHGVKKDLERINDFQRVELRQSGELVAAYGLATKQVNIGNERVKAIHRTTLAVAAEYQHQGYGKLVVENTKRHFLDEAKEPVLLYGYIEEKNSRSLELSKQVGYRSISRFTSLSFSRFSPKKCEDIEVVYHCEEIKELLDAEYNAFSLNDLSTSYLPNNYRVLKRNGKVVAGFQYKRKRWTIVELGGWHGPLLLRIVPHIPYLNRLIPAGLFNYLVIGNIYIEQGEEESFFRLLETVLAKEKLNVALIFLDEQCALFQRLKTYQHFGLLSHLGVESGAYVMTGFSQSAAHLVDECLKRPAFISQVDPS